MQRSSRKVDLLFFSFLLFFLTIVFVFFAMNLSDNYIKGKNEILIDNLVKNNVNADSMFEDFEVHSFVIMNDKIIKSSSNLNLTVNQLQDKQILKQEGKSYLIYVQSNNGVVTYYLKKTNYSLITTYITVSLIIIIIVVILVKIYLSKKLKNSDAKDGSNNITVRNMYQILENLLVNESKGVIVFNKEKLIVYENQKLIALFNNEVTSGKVKDMVAKKVLYNKITNFTFKLNSYYFQVNFESINIRNEQFICAVIKNVTSKTNFKNNQSDFYRHLVHDFRAPFSCIQGVIELSTLQSINSSDKNDLLKMGLSECQRLGTLFDSFSDLSDNISSRDDLRKVNLSSSVLEMVEVYKKSNLYNLELLVDSNITFLCIESKVLALLNILFENIFNNSKPKTKITISLVKENGLITLNCVNEANNEDPIKRDEIFKKSIESNLNTGLRVLDDICRNFYYEYEFVNENEFVYSTIRFYISKRYEKVLSSYMDKTI